MHDELTYIGLEAFFGFVLLGILYYAMQVAKKPSKKLNGKTLAYGSCHYCLKKGEWFDLVYGHFVCERCNEVVEPAKPGERVRRYV